MSVHPLIPRGSLVYYSCLVDISCAVNSNFRSYLVLNCRGQLLLSLRQIQGIIGAGPDNNTQWRSDWMLECPRARNRNFSPTTYPASWVSQFTTLEWHEASMCAHMVFLNIRLWVRLQPNCSLNFYSSPYRNALGTFCERWFCDVP